MEAKHVKQHEQSNVRYCSFFNNNKFCEYEEIGCMFRHEHAPLCKYSEKCKIKLCQFKHESLNINVQKYSCNECNSNFKTDCDLKIHKQSEHNNKSVEDKEVVDESDDEEDDVNDDEQPNYGAEEFTIINPYDFSKHVRCMYGMCSFQSVMFGREKDFRFHLKSVHGID